ncbi:hypothetical protein OH77DRAFT_1450740 [Trametes cingulata]|nr:hypothetical protein OH77DRAFT_1450740 [Trametes cingulata]
MFFCRHQLLRAPAQRQFASLVTTGNALQRSLPSHTRPRPNYVRLSHNAPIPPSAPSTHADASDPASTSSAAHITEVKPELPAIVSEPTLTTSPPSEEVEKTYAVELPSTSSPEEFARFKEEVLKDPLGTYLKVRNGGVEALTTYSSEFITSAIWYCVNRNLREYIPTFVQDIIVIMDQRKNKTRGRVLMEVLFSTVRARPMLTKKDIWDLLQCMKRNDQLHFMRTSIRTLVASTIVKLPPDELDKELLDIMLPLLLEKMHKLGDNTLVMQKWASRDVLESTDSGIALPRILWPLFRINVRLATLDDKVKASELMATLADRQFIEPAAIHETDLSSTDFVYVVLSVLVRTCMKYGWFSRATTLMFSVVPSREEISVPLARLIEDWMVNALTKPREEDATRAATMMGYLFQRTPKDYVVPTKLLQQFYSAAFECNMPELAETVYAHSQEAGHHRYPPPRDVFLLRLMGYMASKSRNVHLARLLARQVVEEDIPLPPVMRSGFIAHVASLGFASAATALWEKYSIGPDAPYVVGNGMVMLRMVGVLMSAADRARAALARRGVDVPDTSRENVTDDASEDQEALEQTTSSLPPFKEPDLPASDAPPSSTTPPPHPHTEPSTQEPPSSESSDSAADPGDGNGPPDSSVGFAALTDAELLAREAELRRFAERVFDAYYDAKQPLERVSHPELTSLARGASMVRRDALSLEVFALMKRVGMKMDMHDANLALGNVARADYLAGADYLERMRESGVQPDAVSFGTVIHWAAHHGDAPLVASLLRQAREAGIADLSFKTLASLLHSTVEGKISEGVSGAKQLQYATEVVQAMLAKDVVPPPSVAQDCIKAAIRAENPTKAFEFWRLYVKGKTEHKDPVQTRIRRSIARVVRLGIKRGWLPFETGTVMLHELDCPMTPLQLARYRASQGAREVVTQAQPTEEKAIAKAKGPEDG